MRFHSIRLALCGCGIITILRGKTMHLETGKIYHLYTRSNNEERVFKRPSDYRFFLVRYRHYIAPFVSTIAYCLMPTHFHLVIRIDTKDCDRPKINYAALLCGYTRTMNRRGHRHGSLFQQKSKAKEIRDERHLMTVILYVHRNPVARRVKRMEEWEYSSYSDLAGFRKGALPDREFMKKYFATEEEFREFSERALERRFKAVR